MVYLAIIITSPYIIWIILTQPKYRTGLGQKLGFFLPQQTKPTLWIHAVSVGETMVATDLAKSFMEISTDYRIMFSTTTKTGQELAKKRLAPDANIFYFPYDLPGAVKRSIKAINPAALVLVDTELWPNVVRACVKHGGKAVLVNGRISDRAFPFYMRYSWLFKGMLKDFSLFLMQTERDGERIVQMGTNPKKVNVAGTLKFDRNITKLGKNENRRIRRSLGIEENAIVLFLGSPHQGEEAALRAAMTAIGAIPSTRLVIAPRRIENVEWIEKSLAGFSMKIALKTEMVMGAIPTGPKSVPIIDTFGELANLYGIADVAFVGGSMISHGGQNPLEPAAHGKAIIYGPDMVNFHEAAKALEEGGGAVRINSEEELSIKFITLLSDASQREEMGKASLAVIENNRGAINKTANIIKGLLDD
jgi:3-deoxy-D-manno-octulosonic-acid transferase